MTEADLGLLSKQMQRLITDSVSTRDDMRVLTAIIMRLDKTTASLIDEIRAVHTQIGRMNDRITKLEDAQ